MAFSSSFKWLAVALVLAVMLLMSSEIVEAIPNFKLGLQKDYLDCFNFCSVKFFLLLASKIVLFDPFFFSLASESSTAPRLPLPHTPGWSSEF